MTADTRAADVIEGTFSATKAELRRAHHLPGWVYSSPELYRREIDEIFLRDWLYAGRVEEVENPGDYMTLRIAEQPIVIARDRKEELHAYYNICVHRGVAVAEGSGSAAGFSCPYHGWTYDLSGQLRSAGHMRETEGFAPKNCHLKPVQIRSWHGNIFVCFNANPMPFDTYIRHFEDAFTNLQMGRCRLANKIRIPINCNWKLVHENFVDFYHVRVLHAGTFGSGFRWDNNAVKLNDDGSMTIVYQSGPPTPKAEPLLGKMPWLEQEDYTFASSGLLPPNFAIFGRIDCVRPMICWPLGPDKCELVIYHLFPEEFHSRPDFTEKLAIYESYGLKVIEEDRSMIESMQQTLGLPAFRPGPMSVFEKAVHHYINQYIDRMYGQPDTRKAVHA